MLSRVVIRSLSCARLSWQTPLKQPCKNLQQRSLTTALKPPSLVRAAIFRPALQRPPVLAAALRSAAPPARALMTKPLISKPAAATSFKTAFDTQRRRLSASMIQSIRSKWEALYDAWPYTVAGAIIGGKAIVSDFVAQYYAMMDDPNISFDYMRNLKFTAFCWLYVGSFQHFVFNILFPYLMPGTGTFIAIKKAICDNFVHSPFLYCPCYYACRAMFRGDSPSVGLHEYWEQGWDVLKACWAVWVPGQFINFFLMPPQYRIMYIAVVGFLWEIILSYIAPMESEAEEAPKKE